MAKPSLLSKLLPLLLINIIGSVFLKKYHSSNDAGSAVNPLLIQVAVNLSVWISYKTFIYPRFLSRLRSLPTAKVGKRTRTLPFIGYGPVQFADARGETLLKMSDTVPNKGLVRFHGFMESECLLLTSPEATQEVLVQKSYDWIKPPAAKKLLEWWFKTDLLFSTEGARHREMKKNMTAFFSLAKVKVLYPLLWERALKMADEIERAAKLDTCKSGTVDIKQFVWQHTLDTTRRTIFGEQIEKSPRRYEIMKLQGSVLGTTWDMRVYYALNAFLPRWTVNLIPGGISERVKSSSEDLTKAISSFIKEVESETYSASLPGIAVQMSQAGFFTDDELVANMLGIVIAAVEPTAAAFLWVIYYLSKYPEWQTKVRDEMKTKIPYSSAIGQTEVVNVADTFESLTYLDAVCNEALRLMPTNPTTNRIAKDDTTILGQYVPAGTKVFVSSYVLDRHPQIWGPTAREYNPGRWLEKRPNERLEKRTGVATSSHAGFLPFLHGSRKCIGFMYAQADIRSLVASLVGRFEFEMADLNEKIIPAGVLSSAPKNGLNIRIKRVEAW
ncbi:cytochrome P450 [Pseudovirgaria hyperparasitica]|uniref:Cytochrome P450 n=1 Tax=Pseudovirgaria hyperparasitica TaxID=470096 RepID=A0A6A6VWH7_9PEZI|nr:cytochrome P450 [Pseudovirgaria hyperparasitica]KAF2754942.1 cytochrome P450 [Pseudovirgaria hyperparasitica]